MSVETYRLTISYNTAGQFAQNVLHYKLDDSLFVNTVEAANALISAWDTHCTAQLKAALPTTCTILSYKCRRVSSSGGFEAVKLGVVGDIGTRSGDESVSGLAPYIRFVTNNVPPIQGRMFLPGVTDTDCLDGWLQAAFFTNLTALADKLDDTLTLTGGGAPSAVPVVRTVSPTVDSIPITTAVPSPVVSTQRRRQRPA